MFYRSVPLAWVNLQLQAIDDRWWDLTLKSAWKNVQVWVYSCRTSTPRLDAFADTSTCCAFASEVMEGNFTFLNFQAACGAECTGIVEAEAMGGKGVRAYSLD